MAAPPPRAVNETSCSQAAAAEIARAPSSLGRACAVVRQKVLQPRRRHGTSSSGAAGRMPASQQFVAACAVLGSQRGVLQKRCRRSLAVSVLPQASEAELNVRRRHAAAVAGNSNRQQ